MDTVRRRCVALLTGVTVLLAQLGATRAQTTDSPALPEGLLSCDLHRAESTDFFTFFRLEETVREKDSAKRDVVVFKPGAADLRKFVTVSATLSDQGRIIEMPLRITRPFIDQPTLRPYANDIVTNMIGSSIPQREHSAIRELVNLAREYDNMGLPLLAA